MKNAELTELLKGLVAIPSLSRQEKDAADYQIGRASCRERV